MVRRANGANSLHLAAHHRGGPPGGGANHVRVGTCGYSYTEWAEAGFYPRGTRAAHMLSLYAEQFSVTELNHTWYQMPRAEAIERQRQRVPPDFLFAVKLNRSLTHEVEQGTWREQASAFRDGIAPLVLARQLLAVLVQLPNSFGRTPEARRHLAALLDELRGLPLAVEFRNAEWATERVFAELQRRRVTLVTVDEPRLRGLFPTLEQVTNPALVYVRLHGRNGRGWYSGSKDKQFDHDYSDQELHEWAQRVERMLRQARRGVVFFNNHVAAQAPRNARTLVRMLRQRNLFVA